MPIGSLNRSGESRQVGASQPLLVNAAVTLKPENNLVWVTLPGSGSYTITLPPATSVPIGQLFFIYVTVDGAGVAAVTGGAYTSQNLTALGDYIVLVSNGTIWLELKELTT